MYVFVLKGKTAAIVVNRHVVSARMCVSDAKGDTPSSTYHGPTVSSTPVFLAVNSQSMREVLWSLLTLRRKQWGKNCKDW
jgi:hypothetical protein